MRIADYIASLQAPSVITRTNSRLMDHAFHSHEAQEGNLSSKSN